MSKIAIVTDSNAGFTEQEVKELGIFILPMPFTIDEIEYFEGVNLSQAQFYEKLKNDASIFTSQPSPAAVLEQWDELLKEYDQVVSIPMSSSLSSTYATAKMLAEDYDGKVVVVDNMRISVTQMAAVRDAKHLVNQGKSAIEIKQVLEDTKSDSSIYITLTTLKYLKKGGRITPAAAAVGSMLKIKPILQIQGGKLDEFSKARTLSHAKTTMIDAVKVDIEHRFGGLKANQVILDIAHTNSEGEALKFKEEVEEAFPGYKVRTIAPLSLSVACHIGDGALALTCTKVLE